MLSRSYSRDRVMVGTSGEDEGRHLSAYAHMEDQEALNKLSGWTEMHES